MSAVSRARVFAAYRKCFRTRTEVFHRDALAMTESRKTIREEFGKNRNNVASGEQFEALISMVDEAVDFLKFGVMQAERDPKTGNYVAKVKKEHMQGIDHADVEPITKETVLKMENPVVEKSGCKSKKPMVESSKDL
mmetsp:Transcript_7630/g.9986  ORF Transcript_7630/g.9986 Transcript_7630/m.9986 type:complete len:137 (-) Transcript_7630:867-1277(-)